MKHYPHHIGDFDKATRHLTRIERSVYRDLIDLYYDTEARLTLDMQILCRRIIARTNEEITAVEQVLNEFFTKTPTGWYHNRCEQVIAAYRANTSQRAMAGKASAEAKRLKKLQALNECLTPVEQPLQSVDTDGNDEATNQITNKPINHKPNKERGSRKREPAPPDCPPDVDPQTWADWLMLRRAKKAPVTRTVLEEAKREADKAQMTLDAFLRAWCMRGSQGLQADWVKPQERQLASAQAQTFAERDEAARRRRWEEMTGRKWPTADESTGDVIDAEPAGLLQIGGRA